MINKLRASHDDEDIKRAAKKVYVKWKTHFVELAERPMIEVKCDLKTEKTRTNARNLLSDAFGMEVMFFIYTEVVDLGIAIQRSS